jgi:hypothetical protein
MCLHDTAARSQVLFLPLLWLLDRRCGSRSWVSETFGFCFRILGSGNIEGSMPLFQPITQRSNNHDDDHGSSSSSSSLFLFFGHNNNAADGGGVAPLVDPIVCHGPGTNVAARPLLCFGLRTMHSSHDTDGLFFLSMPTVPLIDDNNSATARSE